ncbi:hypothetical protein ACO0RG_001698 [Hanseniaspora osmophila]|uniref:Uncharacterized protein n=1 Tax=Hanseniaspora osmophila TaxID=56408 RepID=A0A1E5RGP3_9ASCO|nr:Uncharacterized protein AWRI3579_g1590 [Hanseniaspora osmophila]
MIPQAHYDVALLREHAYYENYDLNIVLDHRTYTAEGGYKPIRDYGLGYFNYPLALSKQILGKNILYGFSMFVYNYFTLFLMLYLVLLIFATNSSDKFAFPSSNNKHNASIGALSQTVSQWFDFRSISNKLKIGSSKNKLKKFDSMNDSDVDHQERGELHLNNVNGVSIHTNNSNNSSSTTSRGSTTTYRDEHENDDLEYQHVKI